LEFIDKAHEDGKKVVYMYVALSMEFFDGTLIGTVDSDQLSSVILKR
jgi:hypothetical protein